MPEPRSPFKAQEFNPTTLKAASNAALEDAMYKISNHPNDMFEGMAQEYLGPSNTGKRIFVDLMNQSTSSNMYPVNTDPNETKELFHRRHAFDFDHKTGKEYVPPPVTKSFLKRHSFVHNTLANKTQSNVEFIETINSDKVLNANKRRILSALHNASIDFRMLRSFKNALFDSEELTEN